MVQPNSFEMLSAQDVAKRFEINEKTLARWVVEGYRPKPTLFGRRRGWRKNQILKWMDATEFLQSMGLTQLQPPDEEEAG